MKIRNNKTFTIKGFDCYLKKKSEFSISCIGRNKNKSTSSTNTMAEILNQKNEMTDIVNNAKMENIKMGIKLGEEKNSWIKSIKDTCSRYSEQLSVGIGFSSKLDSILLGDVDKVTQEMDFGEVSKNINNLEYSLVHNNSTDLKKYYSEGADQYETFSQYVGDNSQIDINKVMSSDAISDEVKGQVGVLETLKKQYEGLYNTMDKIKDFKKNSNKRIEELQSKMENNIKELNKYYIFNENSLL